MSRILVVEDEATLALLATLTLEDEGHDVIVASNGRKGLGAVAEHQPDLVVADFMMPVMDGIEMLRRLRSAGATVPVLLTSALSERQIPGHEDGLHQAYLHKPYHEGELVKLVTQLLGGAGREADRSERDSAEA